MSEKKKYYKIFEDFPDISIIEMITLQILLKYREPIIKYNLYTEVNQFLKNRKTLSTSTFYNSLSSLERKGYISFVRKDSDKRVYVDNTELADTTNRLIFDYFIQNGIINDVEFGLKTLSEVLKIIGSTHFGTVLSIYCYDYIDYNLLDLATKITDEMFVACKKEVYEDFIKSNLTTVKYSEIYNGMLREPDNIFDLVTLTTYQRNLDFYDMSRIDILKESVRVVKKGGVVTIVTRTKMPTTQNFYANELIKAYELVVENRIFTEGELDEDMSSVDFTKYDVIDYQGLLIGIGWL